MTDSRDRDRLLLDVRQISTLLSCSSRHIYRLCDAGRMPRPVRLGALVRWDRAVIERWIAAGCPNCRDNIRPSAQGAEHER
ncbi:MAG: helix-turn-helix domain-containing protein [Phycisphaerales bacterium]|nr:helix-turn-helix domain-containing protein [Phycisphaerales bacterium]